MKSIPVALTWMFGLAVLGVLSLFVAAATGMRVGWIVMGCTFSVDGLALLTNAFGCGAAFERSVDSLSSKTFLARPTGRRAFGLVALAIGFGALIAGA